MRPEEVRSERLALVTTKPLSARRGSGDLLVSMAAGVDGLLGVVAVMGETQSVCGDGVPDQERILGVLEVTARWWGGGARAGEMVVACQVGSRQWLVALLRSDVSSDGGWRLGEWMIPRWPGERAGNAGALIGLFGAPATKAISCAAE